MQQDRPNSNPNSGPNSHEEWTQDEMIAWIDSQPYRELLRWWRFAPSGDPFFQNSAGEYYRQAMSAKRPQEPGQGVLASKSVGWCSPGLPPRKP